MAAKFTEPVMIRFESGTGRGAAVSWLGSTKRVGRAGSEHLAGVAKRPSIAGICTFHREDARPQRAAALYSGCSISIRALTTSKTTGRFLRADSKIAKFDMHRDQISAKVARRDEADDDVEGLAGHCFEIFRVVDGRIEDADGESDPTPIGLGDPVAIRLEGSSLFLAAGKGGTLDVKAAWNAKKCTLTLHPLEGELRTALLDSVGGRTRTLSPTLCFEYQKNFGEHSVGKHGWQVPKRGGIYHFADAASGKDYGEIALNGGFLGDYEILPQSADEESWAADADGWVYALSWEKLLRCEHQGAPAQRAAAGLDDGEDPQFRRRAIVRVDFRRRVDDATVARTLGEALAEATASRAAAASSSSSSSSSPKRLGSMLGAIKLRRRTAAATRRDGQERAEKDDGDAAAHASEASSPSETEARDDAKAPSVANAAPPPAALGLDVESDPPHIRAAKAAAREGSALARWINEAAETYVYEHVWVWHSDDLQGTGEQWSTPASRIAQLTVTRGAASAQGGGGGGGGGTIVHASEESHRSRVWSMNLTDDATTVAVEWWEPENDKGDDVDETSAESVEDDVAAAAPLLARSAVPPVAPPPGTPWRRIAISNGTQRLCIAPREVAMYGDANVRPRVHPGQLEADESLADQSTEGAAGRITQIGARSSWQQPNEFEDCWRAVVQGLETTSASGSGSAATAAWAEEVRNDVVRALQGPAGSSAQLLALDATVQLRLAAESELAAMMPVLQHHVEESETMIRMIEAGNFAERISSKIESLTSGIKAAEEKHLAQLSEGKETLFNGVETLKKIFKDTAQVRELQAALSRIYVQPFIPTGRPYAAGAEFETEDERLQREQDALELHAKLKSAVAGISNELSEKGGTAGKAVGAAVQAASAVEGAKRSLEGSLNSLSTSVEGAVSAIGERGLELQSRLVATKRSNGGTNDARSAQERELDSNFNELVQVEVDRYIEFQRERAPILVAEEQCWERGHKYLFYAMLLMCLVDTALAVLIYIVVYFAK